MSLNVIIAPKLQLISQPAFIEPDLAVNWIGESTDGEKLVEFAGRVCYMSQRNPADRSTADYIANIKKQAHGSVLEHANYSVFIEGVSRSLTHELVRHRAGMAYSQLSQRYVDESDTAFVVPPAIITAFETALAAKDADAEILARQLFDTWRESCANALAAYQVLSASLSRQYEATIPDRTARRKAVREAARAVLPNCTETKLVVTGNVRAWRHIVTMRGNGAADKEIQRFTRALLPILQEACPSGFNDFEYTDQGIVPGYQKV